MAVEDSPNGSTGRLDGSESRRRAADAAVAGDAWECVVAIVRGPLFDGLARRLCRFEHIDRDLAYDVFAAALDDLYGAVRAGREVRDPLAWVRRAALNRADDVEAERRRDVRYDPDRDGRSQPPADADGVSRDVLRHEALRVCWAVVDRIQQTTPRAVVRLILEAVETGRPDGMPASEVAKRLNMTRAAVHTARSRGLQALIELIASEGHELTIDFARQLEDQASSETAASTHQGDAHDSG